MEPESKRPSNLVIILIILILLAASYLGYTIYKANAELDDLSQDNISTETSTSIENILEDNGTEYTLEELAIQNTKESCWTSIDGIIYDITSYIPNHPGGEANIIQVCGKDGSDLFSKPAEHKEGGASDVLSSFKIGILKQ